MSKTQNSLNFIQANLSVRALANWVLDYADRLSVPVSNMKLNKLVYFLVEEYLAKNRCLLTNAKIEAWEHGPVFREVYHSFKEFRDNPIDTRARFFSVQTGDLAISREEYDQELESELVSILDQIIHFSASELRNFSHREGSPWHVVWCHDGRVNPGMEIKPELIIEYIEERSDT